jgi:hypothetical protein
MFRVLVLIGAFVFFRAVLPRTSRWHSSGNTPYMSALDGTLSREEVGSVLDEVTPYEAWLASRRTKACRDAQDEQPRSTSTGRHYEAISPAQDCHGAQLRG